MPTACDARIRGTDASDRHAPGTHQSRVPRRPRGRRALRSRGHRPPLRPARQHPGSGVRRDRLGRAGTAHVTRRVRFGFDVRALTVMSPQATHDPSPVDEPAIAHDVALAGLHRAQDVRELRACRPRRGRPRRTATARGSRRRPDRARRPARRRPPRACPRARAVGTGAGATHEGDGRSSSRATTPAWTRIPRRPSRGAASAAPPSRVPRARRRRTRR